MPVIRSCLPRTKVISLIPNLVAIPRPLEVPFKVSNKLNVSCLKKLYNRHSHPGYRVRGGKEVASTEKEMDHEVVEESYAFPPTPGVGSRPSVVSAPPMQTQYNSPSLSRKPLLLTIEAATPNNAPDKATPPGSSHTPNFFTPLGSPIRKAIQLTKLDPQDAWLPITESRNGNAYYAAFHTLCSGIGIQALVLPVAFTILGW